jgi:hypothetical protein
MKRLLSVFGIIIAQAILTLAVAYAAIYAQRGGVASTIVTYDGVEYADISAAQRAQSELVEKIAAQIETGSARIRYGPDEFVFGLLEISLQLDTSALKKDIDEGFLKYNASNLLTAYHNPYRAALAPKFSLDGEELRDKLFLINELIEREPIAATIDLVNGEVIKGGSEEGIYYDIDASLPKVRAAFERHPFSRYTLAGPQAAPGEREVRKWMPDVPSDALDYVDGVIAEASTPIMDESDFGLLTNAAHSIDKILLFPYETYGSTRLAAGVFSLRKCLGDVSALEPSGGGGYIQIPDNVASQVATTLFIAALEAGIDYNNIFRTFTLENQEYCDPGFGIVYEANGPDFSFENSLESNIVVFAAVEDGQFFVRIAGHVGGAFGPSARKALSTEVKTADGKQFVSVYRDGKLIYTVEHPKPQE